MRPSPEPEGEVCVLLLLCVRCLLTRDYGSDCGRSFFLFIFPFYLRSLALRRWRRIYYQIRKLSPYLACRAVARPSCRLPPENRLAGLIIASRLPGFGVGASMVVVVVVWCGGAVRPPSPGPPLGGTTAEATFIRWRYDGGRVSVTYSVDRDPLARPRMAAAALRALLSRLFLKRTCFGPRSPPRPLGSLSGFRSREQTSSKLAFETMTWNSEAIVRDSKYAHDTEHSARRV